MKQGSRDGGPSRKALVTRRALIGSFLSVCDMSALLRNLPEDVDVRDLSCRLKCSVLENFLSQIEHLRRTITRYSVVCELLWPAVEVWWMSLVV